MRLPSQREVMFDMGLNLPELMPVDTLTKSIQETILLTLSQKANYQWYVWKGDGPLINY